MEAAIRKFSVQFLHFLVNTLLLSKYAELNRIHSLSRIDKISQNLSGEDVFGPMTLRRFLIENIPVRRDRLVTVAVRYAALVITPNWRIAFRTFWSCVSSTGVNVTTEKRPAAGPGVGVATGVVGTGPGVGVATDAVGVGVTSDTGVGVASGFVGSCVDSGVGVASTKPSGDVSTTSVVGRWFQLSRPRLSQEPVDALTHSWLSDRVSRCELFPPEWLLLVVVSVSITGISGLV